jgi:serine phosphatase RsbU (regulator of sigma subunit)
VRCPEDASYITGGHPAPLVMREGRIVKTLEGGHRPLFGLPAATGTPLEEFRIGEETLQPGDWLILYTDGLVEARDHNGEFFGEARLIDFVQRAAASGNPPPETVRTLVRAAMEHQNGVLQDDATVLLAYWGTSDLTP